ncbi:biotin synthase BioB [Clostridium sporogenes]
MSSIIKYKKKVLNGDLLTKEEVEELLDEDTTDLAVTANEIRKSLCGNKFDLCTIINGKSGSCQENCKYCAQSAHFNTDIMEYNILHSHKIINSAISNYNKGVHRFSVVTSGRSLNNNEVDTLCKTYSKLKERCPIGLCASHGLLKYEDLKRLKDSGVMRYHNNLETSRKFFTKICSTHTYDDKIETIKNAKKAGLEICSGGIIGLGETMEDRIDMAFTLRELSVESVPVNILNPIKGTPLENQEILSYEEVIKTLEIFRFILPTVQIRLAGGRALLEDKGKKALMSGINGAISGDMLTTLGIETSEDIKMIKNLGFEV